MTTNQPPTHVLLCLGPCHGEFYLPLTERESTVCPNDHTHPVAVYELRTVIGYGEAPARPA